MQREHHMPPVAAHLRSPANVRRIVRLSVTLAVVGLALSYGVASANHVTCGDIITESTVLDSDLTNCSGNGVVIGAPNVTLDLGDHTIAAANGGSPGSGVLFDGTPGVTVQNGNVVGFFNGVLARRSVGAVVEEMTTGCGPGTCFSEEAAGIAVENSDDARLRRNLIGPVPLGLIIAARNTLTEDNQFLETDVALQLDGGQANYIQRNAFTANRTAILLEDLEPQAGAVVEENEIHRGEAGVVVSGSGASRIRHNRVTGVRAAIALIGAEDNTIVEGNRISGGETGIRAQDSFASRIARNTVTGPRRGIDVSRSLNVVISDNSVRRAEEHGIAVDSSYDTTVTHNWVRRSGEDGIAVAAESVNTEVEGNVSRENLDDGIDVDSPFTTITRNRADRNGDLGIEAVEGVIDGGGNRARGNRNPEQCTGVVCR